MDYLVNGKFLFCLFVDRSVDNFCLFRWFWCSDGRRTLHERSYMRMKQGRTQWGGGVGRGERPSLGDCGALAGPYIFSAPLYIVFRCQICFHPAAIQKCLISRYLWMLLSINWITCVEKWKQKRGTPRADQALSAQTVRKHTPIYR